MFIDRTQIIKDHLNMNDVIERYGFKVNNAGFICCPFHREKTPSMKIFENDFHCFGCGKNGDVISFVKDLFNLNFSETLKRIDVDFNLNLYSDKSFEEVRRSYRQQQALRAKRQREKADRERENNEYWKAFDEWKRLDDNKRIYAPKTPDEEWHPLFIEALQKLSQQEFILDVGR